MSEFTNDARKMLELVGGRENIVSFTHCATRMRFVLADDKKADVKGIEALSCVKGSFTQGGQFQVIIGNRVSQFYDEFSAVSNMDGVDKQEVKKAAKGNMNLLQRAVANLAEIFAPIIPAIIVGGLILGFRNIIGDIKLLEDGTKAITEAYPFWSGVYNFLWLAGEAIFTFLPVGVTWSVCKKMNVDQMLGIVLGITLVSPQLMSASDYVAAVEAGDPVKYWDFGSFHINMVGYQSQVIPAILVGLVFAVIYRFLKKHVPEVISMIVVPFCSLIPAIILAHTIIGPFGRMLGDGLAGVIMAQASAVMDFVFVNRKDAKAREVGIPSFISGYLGVTEPAMFGVNLKYLYPFVGAMLTSGVMGIVSRLFGVIANSVGVGGLPAFLSMRGDKILVYILCIVIDIALAFLITVVLSKTKLKDMGVHYESGK